MKRKKAKPAREIVESSQQVSSRAFEELQRSQHLLESLIAALPPHGKKELADLLQTLARGEESQEKINSVRQRALQIVSDICKPNPSQEIAGPYAPGTEERRQYDRRQK
ncbi:MAG: hypothetical protein ACREUR_00145 [Nitrosospira sp.]